jgi:hypothetical protein
LFREPHARSEAHPAYLTVINAAQPTASRSRATDSFVRHLHGPVTNPRGPDANQAPAAGFAPAPRSVVAAACAMSTSRASGRRLEDGRADAARRATRHTRGRPRRGTLHAR